jgi:hypothetical protein
MYTVDEYTQQADFDSSAGALVPSYMEIYRGLREICEEQQEILHRELDVSALCEAVGKCSKLERFNLRSTMAVVDWWLWPYVFTWSDEERSRCRHWRVASITIHQAKANGVCPRVTCLDGFTPEDPRQYHPDLAPTVVGNLLGNVEVLELEDDGVTIELLSQEVFLPRFSVLKMRHVSAYQQSLEKFIKRHLTSLRLMQVLDVDLKQGIRGNSIVLTPDLLLGMIHVAPFSVQREEHGDWEGGWRLEKSAKRKYAEED